MELFGAVVAAAGGSRRMGGGRPKVLLPLCGKPVLSWSLEALCSCPQIGAVTVVCREEDLPQMTTLGEGLPKPVGFVPGGATRQESVRLGAQALGEEFDYLLVHDGARPLVTGDLIERVCTDALEYGAAAAAVPSKDTCKLLDGDGFVVGTPPRDRLWAVQTPQAFKRDMYLYALDRAAAQSADFTDDCQLIEAAGGRVRLTQGDYRNIKLTTPEDLPVLEALLGDRERERDAMRIGYGYDVHRLVEGRKLILAGVEIPFERGLLGHSDADVLTHAAADAILGAAALGDIGQLFPDTDPQYEDADSLLLLKEVCQTVKERSFTLQNLDCTLIAQRPRVVPYILKMRENLATACGVEVDRISVKATTEEGLGFTGAGEGMAASAVCLLSCTD